MNQETLNIARGQYVYDLVTILNQNKDKVITLLKKYSSNPYIDLYYKQDFAQLYSKCKEFRKAFIDKFSNNNTLKRYHNLTYETYDDAAVIQSYVDEYGSKIGGAWYTLGDTVDSLLWSRDEYGAYDSDFQAFMSYMVTDPGQSLAQVYSDFKTGDWQSGVAGLLIPGLSGISANKDAKKREKAYKEYLDALEREKQRRQAQYFLAKEEEEKINRELGFLTTIKGRELRADQLQETTATASGISGVASALIGLLFI